MASIGNSLDYVKIIKKKNIITIIETHSIQSFSGQGYISTQSVLETTSNIVVHQKHNLQIAIQQNNLIIRSIAGASHTFNFDVLELEGIEKTTILEVAQNLLN